jgi:DJ-1/PfpI family
MALDQHQGRPGPELIASEEAEAGTWGRYGRYFGNQSRYRGNSWIWAIRARNSTWSAKGAEVDIVALETGQIRGWDHKDWGHSVSVDRTIDEIGAGDYDALVLPGGQINPDLLCMIVESST